MCRVQSFLHPSPSSPCGRKAAKDLLRNLVYASQKSLYDTCWKLCVCLWVFSGGNPTCACLNSEPSQGIYGWAWPGQDPWVSWTTLLLHMVHKLINNNNKSKLESYQNNLLILGHRGVFEFPVAFLRTRHFIYSRFFALLHVLWTSHKLTWTWFNSICFL